MKKKEKRQDFQAFTIKFHGITHRVVTELTVLEAFDPANPPGTPPRYVQTRALWDTGATGCMISAGLAKKLGLTPTGLVHLSHAGGTSKSPTYVVNLGLPNHVGIPGVQVTEFPVPSGFDAIIGMDVISAGDFAITNVRGETTMSFRYPSIATIDYVEDAQAIVSSLVGRNDPCPCGSGKKYKRCHGAN